MAPPLLTPSSVGIHLLPVGCLHTAWAMLRKATRAGPVCRKNQGIAGPLLAWPLPLPVTWAKSFVLLTSHIRRNRLMFPCSRGWESCSVQAGQKMFQPSLLGSDFQVGLKGHESKDNINPAVLRLLLETPGKSAEVI